MKTLKYLLFALLALSIVTACGVNDMPEQETDDSPTEQGTDDTVYPVEIAPVLVGKGELSGSEGIAPQNRVITTPQEWNEVKTTMRDRANTLKETDIDFSAYQVIVLFDERHTNGGWSIDITGIVEYPDRIVVSVTNLKTGDDTQVITQPYHIVRIPVSGKKIVFEKADNTVYPVEITPVLVGKGELSGSEGIGPQNRITTTAREWNHVKTAMRDRANTLNETDIDFSAYQVIALFDKIHTTGGWSIDITGIVEYPDKIVVSVTHLKTGNDALVITQPYHIVRIPVSGKRIVFEFLPEQVTPVTPTNEQKSRLDNLFSYNNELLRKLQKNTLFVINNQEDMATLQGSNESLDIDWDKYSIIGCKIITPSISNEILSQQLLEYIPLSYVYMVEVKNCDICYAALGEHYFWAIYAKKLNAENVSLTIKVVE